MSAAVFASRVAFLPRTLEDIDSVNFALSLESFDPTIHQPHPPGYVIYAAVAKLVHGLVADPVRALGLLSALAQAALVFPLHTLLRRLCSSPAHAAAATLLVLANPILWFNGARPMSDSFGLLFVVSTQVLLLRSVGRPRPFAIGSLLAGLAPGVRIQGCILTWPLWAYAATRTPGGRARGALALVAGVALWVAPLVVASGGPLAYWGAFVRTAEESLPFESLAADLTLNRGARALVQVFISPWVSMPVGVLVTLLASLGFLTRLRSGRASLALGLLAFGPYLVLHVLLQDIPTVRYSLPYIPLLAWLAAEGIGWVAERLPMPGGAWARRAAVAAVVAWSAALTLPALEAYHRVPSPPYAVLESLKAEASPPGDFLLAGHHMFFRYLKDRRPELELVEPVPRQELASLRRRWRSGEGRKVLFVADPRRTDLESISPQAIRRLGRWEWPVAAAGFLAGSRPNRAELLRLDRPVWFAGEGWMLSLESGPMSRLLLLPERRAYLAALGEPAFLLVAGEPTAPQAREYDVELRLSGERIDRHDCRAPLLRGYLIPPANPSEGYRPLLAVTRREGSPSGGPFALKGLDYGPRRRPGVVHGEGWHYPERDEALRPFRWTAPRARSLVHVPAGGSRLRVEGVAPLEYLGQGVGVGLQVEGSGVSSRLDRREFRLEVQLDGAGGPFREVLLTSDRGFVPDRIQRNGDRRELALRIYRFSLD